MNEINGVIEEIMNYCEGRKISHPHPTSPIEGEER
jgi:hypothetical protein